MRKKSWILLIVSLLFFVFCLTPRADEPPHAASLDTGENIGTAGTIASLGPAVPSGERSSTQGVVILSSSEYQSGDYLYVVGEVRNDTAGNVRSVRIVATYYNATGGVLGTDYSYAKHDILEAGQKSPFRIMDQLAPGYSSYTLDVRYSQTTREAVPPLPIPSVREVTDLLGTHKFIGEVENTNPFNVRFVTVIATLYDEAGKVINVDDTYAYNTLLTPGQKSPFKLYIWSGPTTYTRRVITTDADSSTAEPPDLRSVNVTHYVDGLGWLHIAGEVENVGTTEARSVEAIVTLYDEAGNVVNCDFDYTDPSTIQPGHRAPFETTFYADFEGWTTYVLYPPVVPTATPTATATGTPPPTETPTATPSPTGTQAATVTATRTLAPTPSTTLSPTSSPSRWHAHLPVVMKGNLWLPPIATPTNTAPAMPTPTATATSATTPSRTSTPTVVLTGTSTPTATPTATRTGTPTQTTTATRTASPTYTPTPTQSPTPTKTATPYAEVRISSLHYSGREEYVSIRNRGSAGQSMTGWKIHSVVGDQWYAFPSGYMLAGGDRVFVNSGPDSTHNPPTDLRWTTRYMWNDDGDEARLYDSHGILVDSRSY